MVDSLTTVRHWHGLGALLLCVLVSSACAAAPVTAPQGTPPRCSDGRPQSEIDAHKRLPLEPRDPAISCVRIAESGSRIYQLRDGRGLTLYEREGGLPVKPSATPGERGTRVIAGHSWEWARLSVSTILFTTMPNSLYVELAMNSTGNTSSDVDEMARIAGTLSP